jgi:hypothetical protein
MEQFPKKESDTAESSYPNRIYDVEKAHRMAIEGDSLRHFAVAHRAFSKHMEKKDPTLAQFSKHIAEEADEEASKYEEHIGELYDKFPW